MSERAEITEVLIEASRLGHRLFRQNVGMGWTGTVRHIGNVVEIRNARPLHAGLCEGSSDIIGWTKDGRFVAIEYKTGRVRTTPEQTAFVRAVRAAGGHSGIARSVEDAVTILIRGEI